MSEDACQGKYVDLSRPRPNETIRGVAEDGFKEYLSEKLGPGDPGL
jgi:hypothetical protein